MVAGGIAPAAARGGRSRRSFGAPAFPGGHARSRESSSSRPFVITSARDEAPYHSARPLCGGDGSRRLRRPSPASAAAARATSCERTWTPMLMFRFPKRTAVARAARSRAARAAPSRPVVPLTRAILDVAAMGARASVAAGTEKSMTTSGWARSTAASESEIGTPRGAVPARSSPASRPISPTPTAHTSVKAFESREPNDGSAHPSVWHPPARTASHWPPRAKALERGLDGGSVWLPWACSRGDRTTSRMRPRSAQGAAFTGAGARLEKHRVVDRQEREEC